jgi:AcrR family transcriptional regulator
MDTRARIVEAARRLFHEKGYLGTSMRDILGESDANSGSLYHFFPTKQHLLLAVLELYRDGIRPMLVEPAWRGIDDPIERVHALLGAYRSFLVESDFDYGCPIGSLALELHEADPPVRELLASNFAAWAEIVRECLDDDGAGLPRDVDRRALSRFVLAAMEGAVMLARTHRSIEPFDQTIGQLRSHLDGLRRPRKGKRG